MTEQRGRGPALDAELPVVHGEERIALNGGRGIGRAIADDHAALEGAVRAVRPDRKSFVYGKRQHPSSKFQVPSSKHRGSNVEPGTWNVELIPVRRTRCRLRLRRHACRRHTRWL